jgi:hypothetical protein
MDFDLAHNQLCAADAPSLRLMGERNPGSDAATNPSARGRRHVTLLPPRPASARPCPNLACPGLPRRCEARCLLVRTSVPYLDVCFHKWGVFHRSTPVPEQTSLPERWSIPERPRPAPDTPRIWNSAAVLDWSAAEYTGFFELSSLILLPGGPYMFRKLTCVPVQVFCSTTGAWKGSLFRNGRPFRNRPILFRTTCIPEWQECVLVSCSSPACPWSGTIWGSVPGLQTPRGFLFPVLVQCPRGTAELSPQCPPHSRPWIRVGNQPPPKSARGLHNNPKLGGCEIFEGGEITCWGEGPDRPWIGGLNRAERRAGNEGLASWVSLGRDIRAARWGGKCP